MKIQTLPIEVLWFQAASKVEVDPEAGEKLRVTRQDFLHSFENDIKPVSWIGCFFVSFCEY